MGLRILGMLAMIGALTGFAVSQALPHSYVGTATLRFVRTPGLPVSMYDRESKTILDSVRTALLSDETLTAMIGRNARLREMLAADPAGDIMDRIRKGTTIEFTTLPNGMNAAVIHYEDELADDAMDITRDLAIQTARLARAANPMGDAKEVTELAGLPTVEPAGATIPRSTTLGFLTGCGLGLVACVFSMNKRLQ